MSQENADRGVKTFDQHLNSIEASRCFRFFLNCCMRPLHDNLFGLKVCHGNIAESVSSDDGIGTSDIRISATAQDRMARLRTHGIAGDFQGR